MVTLGIAILLAAGLAASKIAQRFRLPSVTGYILAGLLLGPTGIGFITDERVGHNLAHFTQIALMLIAFGIGEHIEIKKLRQHTRSLKWIGLCEAAGAYITVSILIFITIHLTGFTVQNWINRDYLVLSMLLGAIGVATAPAATLLVIRELKAKGPLTSTLMAIVAIDDGIAIMFFGLVVSIAHQLLGQSGDPALWSVGASIMEIFGSILLGLITAALLIVVLDRLEKFGELMTAGLAILLLLGEIALALHLSPLLAGMTAGFTLVNKAERDVRIFRALNRFEPPIYVLFFTLAGSHLDISSLRTAGILGIVYFLATVSGKIAGVNLGALIADSPPLVRKYLGFAMLPQAGVAIGLIFLLSSDDTLAPYATVITPVVLTGVFLSELIGPISARFALTRAGETGADTSTDEHLEMRGAAICALDDTFRIIPWKWQKLKMEPDATGYVVFHTEEPAAARGLARTATILASHYRAQPMAVHVVPVEQHGPHHLFLEEHAEVHHMGYSLATELVPGPDIAAGIVAAVECNDARAVVLGYPMKKAAEKFRKLLDTVANHVRCPVLMVRFYGELHTEKILVVFTDVEELAAMYEIIAALDGIGEHKLSLMYLMPSEAEKKEITFREKEVADWLGKQPNGLRATIRATPADSRVDAIEEAAGDADVVVMAAGETSGVERILFGSLVDSVAAKVRKTLIVVYNAGKDSKVQQKLDNLDAMCAIIDKTNSTRNNTPTITTSHQEEKP